MFCAFYCHHFHCVHEEKAIACMCVNLGRYCWHYVVQLFYLDTHKSLESWMPPTHQATSLIKTIIETCTSLLPWPLFDVHEQAKKGAERECARWTLSVLIYVKRPEQRCRFIRMKCPIVRHRCTVYTVQSAAKYEQIIATPYFIQKRVVSHFTVSCRTFASNFLKSSPHLQLVVAAHTTVTTLRFSSEERPLVSYTHSICSRMR